MSAAPRSNSDADVPPPGRGAELLLSLVSAALFLYVGFGLGLSGASGDAWYDGSISVFTWGAKIVGIGLLVSAVLFYFRVPGAALVDFGLAALAAAGCLVVGAIWLIFQDGQGILLLLFGVLNGSAAKGAWQRWRRRAARAGGSDGD